MEFASELPLVGPAARRNSLKCPVTLPKQFTDGSEQQFTDPWLQWDPGKDLSIA
jgi:hypothetical protein